MLDYYAGYRGVCDSFRTYRCDYQSQNAMSVLGWMAQYENMRVEPTSRMIKVVRLRKLAEAIDPDLDVTTRTLMQLQVEAALEELGTNDSPIIGGCLVANSTGFISGSAARPECMEGCNRGGTYCFDHHTSGCPFDYEDGVAGTRG